MAKLIINKTLIKEMHSYNDLIYRSTSFTLDALEVTNSKIIEELQTSGSTDLVKNLQMIQLQRQYLRLECSRCLMQYCKLNYLVEMDLKAQ